MYRWVSQQPYRHHRKWRVWFLGIDGQKCHNTFETEDAASAFIQVAKTKVLVGG